jgi:aminomethyltransferase
MRKTYKFSLIIALMLAISLLFTACSSPFDTDTDADNGAAKTNEEYKALLSEWAKYIEYKAPEQEKKLRTLAESLGGREVTEFQVMAWTLPCEAGYFYMRDLKHTNPFEVGLEGGINWDKDFIGKEALLKIKEEGAKREVVGFTVAEVDIHIKGRNLGNEGEKVYVDGEEIGRVMKITYSYVNETNNGTIICKKGALKPGDKVLLHGHEAVICAPRFI